MQEIQPITGFPLLASSSLKIAIMFGVLMLAVAYATLAERKISAFIQDRVGPNRVGPFGLLQPIADGLKNLVKEEAVPGSASKFYFMLGPMMAMVPGRVISGMGVASTWDFLATQCHTRLPLCFRMISRAHR